jgi:hypothetical protein
MSTVSVSTPGVMDQNMTTPKFKVGDILSYSSDTLTILELTSNNYVLQWSSSDLVSQYHFDTIERMMKLYKPVKPRRCLNPA